jgi:hypothetical protein
MFHLLPGKMNFRTALLSYNLHTQTFAHFSIKFDDLGKCIQYTVLYSVYSLITASQTFVAVIKTTSRKEEFVSAHSFTDLSPWSLAPLILGLWGG